MLYKEHWDELKMRMEGYWAREAMDRCCAAITVRRPGMRGVGGRNFYFDAEESDRVHRINFAAHECLAEAMPIAFSYFGTAGVAEYVGCRPERTPETTWFHPCMEEPEAEEILFRDRAAFQAQKEALERHVALAKGDYLVSVTDNCGVMDALAAIRGSEELLMDMIADPEFVEEALQRLLPIYKETQEQLFDVVRENNDGCVHSWMQIWAPKRLAQMQCDMSVMISQEMFNRFVMPELEELSAFLDYAVYHLDGQEQIRHVDSLLSIKGLKAIQWTHVAGQPRTSEFIPVLQKIQKAGKNLVLLPHKSEVGKLLDNLSCRGLQLIVGGVETREEAEDMLEFIRKHSKDRG